MGKQHKQSKKRIKPHQMRYYQVGFFPFEVAFCATKLQWDHLKAHNANCPEWHKDGKNHCTRFEADTGDSYCVVCLDTGLEPYVLLPLIAHEAVHVAQYLFKFIGEHNPSKELEAYCVQDIVGILMSEVSEVLAPDKKRKPKRKSKRKRKGKKDGKP